MSIPTTLVGNTQILRNANLDPLSDRQLKQFAPTIFAESGIEGVSERYGHVSTIDIINAMRKNGFEPVEVRQSKRRAEERMAYTKHMLKFRQKGDVRKLTVGDVVQQAVMLNSHDRSSGFHLYHGLFRLICSNGMLVGDSANVEPIKVHHTVRLVQDIVERSIALIEHGENVLDLRKTMLKTILNERQVNQFAVAALEFRPARRKGVMEPAALLEVRRPEDNKSDLWHIYNRVQENMLRAGNETATETGRMTRTRGIGRIERDVSVNTKLWSLAVQTIEKARKAAAKGAPAKRAKKAAEVTDEI